jgi:hypothetical protein
MDIGSAQEAQTAAGAASSVMQDSLGAQLISKTLDRLHAARTLSGVAVDPSYQFQKDVLQSIGIGQKVDSII